MISHVNYMLLTCATLICVFLYNVKYDAQQAERALSSLSREIASERSEVRLLQAEWALRTEPQRLQRLADGHLDMAPVRAEQIVTIADLPAPAIDGEEPVALPALMASAASANGVVLAVGPRLASRQHADARAALAARDTGR